ncbi:MAG: biotin--[acetyl-CoA-carboxylase] ligase [Lentisphaerota bacterium]
MPDIVRLKEIDSTNKYAIENFDSLKDRTLVTASSQTAGKGRRMKNWLSPEGVNLYASFVIKQINFNVSISSWIGGLAALYTVREIASEIDKFWIKWPNDIYSNDRKLAGVLCETVSDSQNHPIGVIIGIGINVNMTKEQLSSIDKPATSLWIENGIHSSIEIVGEILLGKMNYFTNIARKSEEKLYKLWKADNKIVGRKVNVDILGRDPISGKVVDIKPCGSLYLMDENGDFHTFYSGDISVKSFDK